MADLICESCGASIWKKDDEGIASCPRCGAEFVAPLLASRNAMTRLRRSVTGWPGLTDDVRRDLGERLDRAIAASREEEHRRLAPPATAAPEEKAPYAPAPTTGSPPPLPVARPVKPPPVTARPVRSRRPPKPARTGPSIWTRLGPVFAENLLFTLAAFLLVAGAVYFVTTAWTTMSGVERRLVVVAGLLALGGTLAYTARLVNRDGALPEAERLLLLVVGFLVPTAAAPAGELLSDAPLLGLVAAAAVLGPGWLALRRLARTEDPALSPGLPLAVLAFSGLVLFGPTAAAAPVSAATAAALLLLVSVRLGARRVLPSAGAANAPILRAGLLLGFAALVLAAVASLATVRGGRPIGLTLTIPGVVIAGLGAAAAALELALARAGRLRGNRHVPLLLFAIAAGVAGAAVASGEGRAVLVAASLGAFAGILAGLRLPVPLLLVPGLVLSVFAYFYLPAPVRELATRARDAAARGLGYEPRRLPYSFYGLTFLPYVATTALGGLWAAKRGLEEHGRRILGFALLVAIGLAGLSLFAGDDLRAPAAVLGAQGALFLGLGCLVDRRWLAAIGTVGLLAGFHCGLRWLGFAVAPHALFLAAAGLVLLLVARFAGRRAGATAGVADGVGIVAVAAAVLTLFSLPAPLFPMPERGRLAVDLGDPGFVDAAGFGALALLLVLLSVSRRRPEGVALAVAPLLRVAEGAALAASDPLAAAPLAIAGAAAILLVLVLFAERMRRWLPAAPLGPELPARAALPGATVVLAAAALAFLPPITRFGRWDAGPAVSLTALAGLVVLASRLARQDWAAFAPAVLLPAAGFATAAALGGDPTAGPGALGFAAGLGLAALVARRPRAPARMAVPIVGAFLLAFLVTRLPMPAYRASPTEGYYLAGAALLLSVTLGLSKPVLATVLGALAVALVPVGVLDALGAPLDRYPLGFLLAAAAVGVAGLARPAFGANAVAHLALALGTALVAGFGATADGRLLLLAFAGIVEGGRMAARSLPRLGGTFFLVAILGGASLALGEHVLHLEFWWQPAIALAFAAGALLAPRFPVLRVGTFAARVVAAPILAVAAAVLVGSAAVVAAVAPSATDLPTGAWVAAILDATAFAAGVFLMFPGRQPWRRTLGAVGLLLAVFLFAPLNQLLTLFAGFPRPDIEVALVGLLLVLRHPFGSERRGTLEPLAYLLAAGALLLTAGEVDHVSTPLAVLAAASVPWAFWRRGRGAVHREVAGYGVLLAGLAFAAWAVPKTGKPAPEIFPLFALIAAAAAPLLRWFGARVSVAAGALSLLFVAANAIAMADAPADGIAISLSVAAVALTAGVSVAALRRGAGASAFQGVVGAVVALYLFLAVRTGALDLLEDLHLHVLAAGGILLLLFFERLPTRLRAVAILDALLFPAPAALVSIPAILGPGVLAGREPLALFLAAAVYGTAATRFERESLPLGAVAAVLLNFALFALWRRQGFVDPAFYGVPPGATLLVASELMRGRATEPARIGVLVAGAALLYGSVGVQVLRVEEPTHALLLFGLGLLTVMAGFVRGRHGLLVTGAVVVVLDVMAYLARHGFEESFLAAGLLVLAGLTVLGVAVVSTRRRRAATAPHRP